MSSNILHDVDEAPVSDHGYSKTSDVVGGTIASTEQTMQQQQPIHPQNPPLSEQQLLQIQQRTIQQQQQHILQHQQQRQPNLLHQRQLQQHLLRQQQQQQQQQPPHQPQQRDQRSIILQQHPQIVPNVGQQLQPSQCSLQENKLQEQRQMVQHHPLPQQQQQQPQQQQQQQVAVRQPHLTHQNLGQPVVLQQNNPGLLLQQQQQLSNQPLQENLSDIDIKNKEKELEQLQIELQKCQQQTLVEGATQRYETKAAQGLPQQMQHLQQQQQQMQQQQIQQQQIQQHMQQQQQQIQQQHQQQPGVFTKRSVNTSHMQSLPTSTNVSTLTSCQRAGQNIPQMAGPRSQFVVQVAPQQQHPRTQNPAPQHLVKANLAHPNQPATSQQGGFPQQPNALVQPFMTQQGQQGQQGMVAAGQVVAQNPGHQAMDGQEVPMDCDEVLLLPADSSDGASSQMSLSQGSSTGVGDGPEPQQTPPLVSSTSGLVIQRKIVKGPGSDQKVKGCCDCKRKVKCTKCPCNQKGGCDDTCPSPVCHFRTQGQEGTPGQPPRPKPKPRPKAKPMAAVIPNMIGAAVRTTMAHPLTTPTNFRLTPLATGSAANPAVSCASPEPSNDLYQATVVQSNTFAPGFGPEGTEEGAMSRQQAAQVMASMSNVNANKAAVTPTAAMGGNSELGGVAQRTVQTSLQRPQQHEANQTLFQGRPPQDQPPPGVTAAPMQRLMVEKGSKMVRTPDGRVFIQTSDGKLQPLTLQPGSGARVVTLGPGGNQTNVNRPSLAVTPTTDSTGIIRANPQQPQQVQSQQQQHQQQQPTTSQQQQQQQQQVLLHPQQQLQVQQVKPVNNSGAISIHAMSPSAEGEGQELAPPLGITNTSTTLKVGMEYKLDYKDGTSRITIWDGEHFRIKGSAIGGTVEPAGTVRGGGGGNRQAQQRIIKGNATGLNMVAQRNNTNIKVAGRQEMSPQPNTNTAAGGRRWVHSTVGKEQLSRRPLHPEMTQAEGAGPALESEESNDPDEPPGLIVRPGGQAVQAGGQAVQANTPSPVLKRPRKPTEEGKYAVCLNCGQLSSDYDICEGCSKLLPDEPKYFWPGHPTKVQRTEKPGSTTPTTIIVTQPAESDTTGQTTPAQITATQITTTQLPTGQVLVVDKKKFYGNKPAGDKVPNSVVYVYHQGRKVRPAAKPAGVKGARGGAQGGRGRGRAKKQPPEPETVTILSSDDESSAMASPGAGQGESHEAQSPLSAQSPGLRTTPSPATPSPGTPTPSTPTTGTPSMGMAASGTLTSATPALLTPIAVSRRQKMENASGQVIKPNTRVLNAGGHSRIMHTPAAVSLESRSIRLGSLKGTPFERVIMTPTGINIKMEYESENLELTIQSEEVVRVLGHFGLNMPVLFIYTTPLCAQRVRVLCHMSSKSGPYFDPTSKEEPHRRITIIINTINQQQIGQIRQIFQIIQEKNRASHLLREIESDQANVILVKSTPHFGRDGMVVPMMGLVADYDGDDFDDEDDEPYDRSRSPSPPRPVFSGTITRLLTYPAPPATGGISITNEDLFCLNEGEFLNDVIIDFYLKYLFFEILSEVDKPRTHIFSSFFYRRLTQRSKRNDEDLSLSLQHRRHQRVRTWTRHVDLFSKDFIIVPINESAHWYLAVICFPGMTKPVYRKEPATNGTCADPPKSATPPADKDGEAKEKEKTETDAEQPMEGTKDGEAASTEGKPTDTPQNNGDATPAEINKAGSEAREESPMETDQTEEEAAPKEEEKPKEPTEIEMKQPCILIFDSLAGPTRGTVIRTLREYLAVEWETRQKDKKGARVFDRDTFKGGNPKCPQQTNFSDCGIFVLQYVESFFETPIQDYSIPMKALAQWFPDERVRGKREELKQLILTLMRKYNPDLNYDPSKDMVT